MLVALPERYDITQHFQSYKHTHTQKMPVSEVLINIIVYIWMRKIAQLKLSCARIAL